MPASPRPPHAGIDRRTLVRTAAWAAPAVAVATTAPAFASSGAGALGVSIDPGTATFSVSTWNNEKFFDAHIADARIRLRSVPAEAVTLQVTLEFRPTGGATTTLEVTEKTRPSGWTLGTVTDRVNDVPSGYVVGRTITWKAATTLSAAGEVPFSGAVVGPYGTQRFGELVLVATAVDAGGRVLGRSAPWAVASPSSYPA